MGFIKKPLIILVKIIMAANAVFWLMFAAAGAADVLKNDEHRVAGCILLFVFGLFAVGPFIFYFYANRTYQFDTSENIFVRLFKLGFKREKYQPNPEALEIYRNNDGNWLNMFLGVSILAVGLLSVIVSMQDGFSHCLAASTLFGFPVSIIGIGIIIFHRNRMGRPFLILTNSGLSFTRWKCDELLYEKISSVVMQKGTLKIVTDKTSYEIRQREIDYSCAQLTNIIEKKIGSPDTPIKTICDGGLGETYAPNEIPIWDRIVGAVYAIAFLIYTCHGLAIGELILPGRRGREPVELYGVSIVIMAVSAICFLVAFIVHLADHYDRRNNEKIYRKIKRCAYGMGLGTLFLASMSSIIDSHSANIMTESRNSTAGSMTATVFKRYIATGDAMNDKKPMWSVSVYPAGQTLPDGPPNTAFFKKCNIENFYWEDDTLVIEYSVLKNAPQSGRRRWSAHAQVETPVPLKLVRIDQGGRKEVSNYTLPRAVKQH